MRVECRYCGSKMVVTSSTRLARGVRDLYCSCTDPECAAVSVYTVGPKHDLQPPRRTAAQVAIGIIRQLPPRERAAVQADLFGQEAQH